MEVAERPRQRFATWARKGVEVPSAAGTLLLGAVALALVLLGPLAVIAAHGFVPYERIVDGIFSPATLSVAVAGIGAGAATGAVGFSIYRRMPTKRAREQAIAGAVLGLQAAIFGTVFLVFRTAGDPERFAFHFLNFQVLKGFGGAFVNGAKNTLFLAFIGEMGGVILGLVLAILVLSKRRVVRALARAYINFFRGTPLLWQLSVFYFGLALGFNLPLSAFQTAMLVFALNTGAYASEVFRAGIQSIERGQMEAARSLGMSYLQSMRFAIVPQAVRRVIPPLMNEFVILIKDTSLITVLGLAASEFDLFTLARTGYAQTFNATFFVAAAFGYLVVTLPLIRLVNMVERRLRSGLVSVI
jgi:polar amino acid transport system permease protein